MNEDAVRFIGFASLLSLVGIDKKKLYCKYILHLHRLTLTNMNCTIYGDLSRPFWLGSHVPKFSCVRFHLGDHGFLFL